MLSRLFYLILLEYDQINVGGIGGSGPHQTIFALSNQ